MYGYVFGNTWNILGQVFEVHTNKGTLSSKGVLRLPTHFSPHLLC